MHFGFKSMVTRLWLGVAVLSAILLMSCNDYAISTDSSKKLNFSTDTLTFDTVFTTIGSTTKKLLVYNRHNKALNVGSIALSGGKNSPFRINVDGTISENNSFSDIEIPAKDSIYIFVEVTVNPNNTDNPLLITDSLIFSTNGNLQRVQLEAIGQDVEIFSNKTILNDTVLSANKPYLIYGDLKVDTAKTLTIAAGSRLYFHNNANLVVYGHLKVNGSFEKPVIMQGDRLDSIRFNHPIPYQNVAGQWGGVYLLWSGGNHNIQHLNIRSGYVGLYFVNNDRFHLPSLRISDSRIRNFVYYGLVAQNGNVTVTNSEISNTGGYTVYLTGGKHEFIHCTIANYMNSSDGAPVSRDKNPAVMLMDIYRNAPMQEIFKNCIIMGSTENELSIASRFVDKFNAAFSNCYIRKKSIPATNQFQNIIWYTAKDSVFISTEYNYKTNKFFNFVPDSVSPARGIANKTIAASYPKDLNGNSRTADNEPDAGAYEWIPAIKK